MILPKKDSSNGSKTKYFTFLNKHYENKYWAYVMKVAKSKWNENENKNRLTIATYKKENP